MTNEIKLPEHWIPTDLVGESIYFTWAAQKYAEAYATQAIEAYKAQQQVEAMTDLQGRLVAISLAVANQDDRTAQSLLSETLRSLAAAHNAGA